MKKSLITASIIGTLAFNTAFADNTNYNIHTDAYLGGTIGGGLGAIKDSNEAVQTGFEGPGGTAFIGNQFTPYFGIEADYIGVSFFLSQLNIFGVLARGTIPLGDRFSLYGKAGFGMINTRIDNFFDTGMSYSSTEGATLLGAGASLALTKNFSLNLDYSGAIQSNKAMDGLYGILGLGFSYYFN